MHERNVDRLADPRREEITKALTDVIIRLRMNAGDGSVYNIGEGGRAQSADMAEIAYRALSRNAARDDASLTSILTHQLSRYAHDDTSAKVEQLLASDSTVPDEAREVLLDALELSGGPGEFSLENDSTVLVAQHWERISAAVVCTYRNLTQQESGG